MLAVTLGGYYFEISAFVNAACWYWRLCWLMRMWSGLLQILITLRSRRWARSEAASTLPVSQSLDLIRLSSESGWFQSPASSRTSKRQAKPAPGPASHGASSCPATPPGKVVPSHLACSLRSIAIWGRLCPASGPGPAGTSMHWQGTGNRLHRMHVSERTPRSSHQPSCQVHIPRLYSQRARMLHTARGLGSAAPEESHST